MSALAAASVLALAAVMLIELARAVAAVRRALRLRRAMHELRRPLQALALAAAGHDGRCDRRGIEACLEQARFALAELEAAVDRRPRRLAKAEVALAELARGLEDRWRAAGVTVDPPLCGDVVRADPNRLGAALDNLVANALRHGSSPVRVRTLTAPGVARFEVEDAGPAQSPQPDAGSDPRRGHGLPVAAAAARAHGGVLTPPRRMASGETVAAISLPTSSERAG